MGTDEVRNKREVAKGSEREGGGEEVLSPFSQTSY